MFLTDLFYAKYFSDNEISIFRQYLKVSEHFMKKYLCGKKG